MSTEQEQRGAGGLGRVLASVLPGRRTPRRRLCRAVFLAACVTPTLLIAAGVAVRLFTDREAAQIAALGRQLGVRIDTARIETPRPGLLRLTGVSLRDREEGAVWAECDRLEARPTGRGWLLTGRTLKIDADHLSACAKRAEGALRSDWLAAARFRFDRLELRNEDGAVAQWEQAAATLSASDRQRGREFELTALGPGADRLSLIAVRNRQIEPPTTRLTIETGASGVAWGPLACLASAGDAINDDSWFTGRIHATLGEETTGSLSGELRGVAVDELLGVEPRGLALDDRAAVRVDAFSWSGERITELRAAVVAGAGVAGRRLVYAANADLQCGAGAELQDECRASAGGPVAFDELAFSVAIDSQGVRLRGGCRDSAGGPMPCVLARGGRPLLYHPAAERLELAALVRFAARPGAPMRPSGRVADKLWRRLPPADVASSAGPRDAVR